MKQGAPNQVFAEVISFALQNHQLRLAAKR
jgi:hypothetical protein